MRWSSASDIVPFQPEHQPVVEVGRVIEPVPIGDQRVGHGAQIEELVPVGVVAGEAGDLGSPKMIPTFPRPTSATSPLEALPGGGLGA